MPSERHFLQSSFREKTLEHIFVAECLRALWQRGIVDVEILRSEVDAAGYDIVFEFRSIVRHVQLKSSYLGAKTARQNLNNKLSAKPSGCAVWMRFDPDTLVLGPFLWYGSQPGEKIDDLSKKFRKAKHTKGTSEGNKLERKNSYSIPRHAFTKLETVDDVVKALFGDALTS